MIREMAVGLVCLCSTREGKRSRFGLYVVWSCSGRVLSIVVLPSFVYRSLLLSCLSSSCVVLYIVICLALSIVVLSCSVSCRLVSFCLSLSSLVLSIVAWSCFVYRCL